MPPTCFWCYHIMFLSRCKALIRTVSLLGSIVQDEIVSPALGGQRKPFLVYLPPSYNTPAGQAKRYPTLYLLHGSPGIAVHHPDLFGVVISLGGYYRAEGSIWGHNAAYMRENSSLDILPSKKDAWRLHMYIGAATQDQPYYNYARQFVQELIKLHISYHFDIQNGFHSWKVWQTQIYNALTWLHWG